MIAKTPPPPYYAVIFTSIRAPQAGDGYSEMADRMVELAKTQPGFLGFESARDEVGISVSYWSSLEAIHAWKADVDHRTAQENGARWYSAYQVRICHVERAYGVAPD